MSTTPIPRWIVSVDLGQTQDPTAVAILECVTEYEQLRAAAVTRHDIDLALEAARRPGARCRIDVRHLERLPLQMSYVDQVAHVASLLRRPPLDRVRPDLLVDQTGVGRPVVDMFRRAGLRPIGVTITAGDSATRTEQRDWRVAKLLLVGRLQAALHAGDLRVASGLAEAATLVAELQDFRGTITETGYARFGARDGAHDDLVLAVGIGVWWAGQQQREPTVSSYTIEI
jgi:hypothetical protein